ncbi:hypothetical protein FACS1894176_07400 [Bacteroidia bacterium]|nr:hypothetical protein FACS1894176_07400 [Bacteroidia bacterium]
MTELFAMYAIKPDHLKEYLTDYLVNISDAEADRLGLKKLTPEVGKHIYELVDTLLKKIMKGDLSGIESQIKKEKTTEEKPEGEENSEELNEKKNKETLELLKKATWTNKKGKKEILFESEKIGMAMDK